MNTWSIYFSKIRGSVEDIERLPPQKFITFFFGRGNVYDMCNLLLLYLDDLLCLGMFPSKMDGGDW